MALIGGTHAAALPIPIGVAGGSGGIGLDPLGALFLFLSFFCGASAEWWLPAGSSHARATLRLLVATVALAMLAADVALLAIGGAAAILLLGGAGRRRGIVRISVVSAMCLAGACAAVAGLAAPAGTLLPDVGFSLLRSGVGSGRGGIAAILPPLLTVAAVSPLLGVWPLHGWHRRLCDRSDPHVPVLAGALGLFLLLRLLPDLAGDHVAGGCGIALIVFGVVAAGIGGWSGLGGQRAAGRLRRISGDLLAVQHGLVLVAVGISLLARANDLPVLAGSALQAALILVPVQMLAGLAVLSMAHLIEHEAGAALLARLGGLVQSMPRATALMLTGVAMLGFLPPFGGFAGLWLLIQSSLPTLVAGGAVMTVLAIATTLAVGIIAGLSSLAWLRLIASVLLGRPRTPRGAAAQDIEGNAIRAPLALLSVPVLIGLLPGGWLRLVDPLVRSLASGADTDAPPWGHLLSPGRTATWSPLPLTLLFLLAFAACVWVVRRLAVRPERREPAWEGGFAPLPPWLPFGDPLTQAGAAALPRALVSLLFGERSGGTVPARRRRLPGWRISQRRIRLGASVLTGHGERRAGLLCLALLAVMLAVLVSWADLA